MTDRKGFDLGDYVEVKDRIKILYEFFPQARIETTYDLTSEPDEKPKVIARAYVYRQPDDEKPAGFGTSWLYLPGTTPYTKGSEIENAETSAVGRAIGMLGILIDKSLATSNEIENKAGEEPPVQAPAASRPYQETEELVGDYAGAGIVRPGTAEGYKLEARLGPDGHVIGFRMEFRGDKAIPQVVVAGPAGEALFIASGMNPAALADSRLHVKGRLYNVKSNRPRSQSWKRLKVTEWSNADYRYPPTDEDAGPEPPEDVHLFGESEVPAA